MQVMRPAFHRGRSVFLRLRELQAERARRLHEYDKSKAVSPAGNFSICQGHFEEWCAAMQ